MTPPLAKPGRKNALLPTPPALVPPIPRSRTAIAFTLAAARGRFQLQHCAECHAIIYPFRDCCPKCLSVDLVWRDTAGEGTVIAETTIHVSQDNYFLRRLPWRIGTVQLDGGPPLVAHLHGDVGQGDEVRLIARTDKGGNGVIMAMPRQETPNMMDDPQLRELSCSPKYRRVLITDAGGAMGQGIARSMLDAGADAVILGMPRLPVAPAVDPVLREDPRVSTLLLDVTDGESVRQAAAAVGGKVDILINTAIHLRPGNCMSRNGLITDRREMEVNYFGLLNLINAFGPAMAGRGGDEPRSATAWVNLVSVHALAAAPRFGGSAGSFAAAHAALQMLRGELRMSGIKVIMAYVGPLDDEWHIDQPPPKAAPAQIATAVRQALEQGKETVTIGAVAEDIERRWREDPELLARELGRG